MDIVFVTECAAGANDVYIPTCKPAILRAVRYTADADPGDNSVGITQGTDVIVDASEDANDLSATPGAVTAATMADGAGKVVVGPDAPAKMTITVTNPCTVSVAVLADEFAIK